LYPGKSIDCKGSVINFQQSLLMSETDTDIPKAKLSEFLHHALDQAYEMGTDVSMDLVIKFSLL